MIPDPEAPTAYGMPVYVSYSVVSAVVVSEFSRNFQQDKVHNFTHFYQVEAKGIMAMDTDIIGRTSASDPYVIIEVEFLI